MNYNHLKGNKHLTDYKETKEAVIANTIKDVPEAKKKPCKAEQQWIGK